MFFKTILLISVMSASSLLFANPKDPKKDPKENCANSLSTAAVKHTGSTLPKTPGVSHPAKQLTLHVLKTRWEDTPHLSPADRDRLAELLEHGIKLYFIDHSEAHQDGGIAVFRLGKQNGLYIKHPEKLDERHLMLRSELVLLTYKNAHSGLSLWQSWIYFSGSKKTQVISFPLQVAKDLISAALKAEGESRLIERVRHNPEPEEAKLYYTLPLGIFDQKSVMTEDVRGLHKNTENIWMAQKAKKERLVPKSKAPKSLTHFDFANLKTSTHQVVSPFRRRIDLNLDADEIITFCRRSKLSVTALGVEARETIIEILQHWKRSYADKDGNDDYIDLRFASHLDRFIYVMRDEAGKILMVALFTGTAPYTPKNIFGYDSLDRSNVWLELETVMIDSRLDDVKTFVIRTLLINLIRKKSPIKSQIEISLGAAFLKALPQPLREDLRQWGTNTLPNAFGIRPEKLSNENDSAVGYFRINSSESTPEPTLKVSNFSPKGVYSWEQLNIFDPMARWHGSPELTPRASAHIAVYSARLTDDTHSVHQEIFAVKVNSNTLELVNFDPVMTINHLDEPKFKPSSLSQLSGPEIALRIIDLMAATGSTQIVMPSTAVDLFQTLKVAGLKYRIDDHDCVLQFASQSGRRLWLPATKQQAAHVATETHILGGGSQSQRPDFLASLDQALSLPGVGPFQAFTRGDQRQVAWNEIHRHEKDLPVSELGHTYLLRSSRKGYLQKALGFLHAVEVKTGDGIIINVNAVHFEHRSYVAMLFRGLLLDIQGSQSELHVTQATKSVQLIVQTEFEHDLDEAFASATREALPFRLHLLTKEKVMGEKSYYRISFQDER